MEVVVLGLFLLCCLFGYAVSGEPILYNVSNFGARGDGSSDDTQKFLTAWMHACADRKPSTILIPSGNSYLLSQTEFEGPCKSSIRIQIDGEIVAPRKIWSNPSSKWLTFSDVDNLEITGSGRIDGKGSQWWDCFDNGGCKSRPDMVGLDNCNNAKVRGITFLNAPKKHLTVSESTKVLIDGITISAPDSSPNTDGIHIQKSSTVLVSNCNIGSGDDCIAFGTGAMDVNVTDMNCGPGHGISIGSLGMNRAHNTVENIRITNCTLNGTTNGIRIKTWQGGSGYVKNVKARDIVLHEVKKPINIDQYYCPHKTCKNQTSAVAISDVAFKEIKGTAEDKYGIQLACSETVACTKIILQDIRIFPSDSSEELGNYCLNAKGETAGAVVPKLTCLN